MGKVNKKDLQIAALIRKEQKRQKQQLQMIPSENYASKAVMKAVGSVLMNKYSEGQVGKRYYQGNKIIDQVEALCKERALKVFKLDSGKWSVNVQALSGTPANLAVYTALLEPKDIIMCMYLYDGGHLSHGWVYKGANITFTSKIWNIRPYHVDPKTLIFDYDQIEKQAREFQPKLFISGGTAYPREINHRRMGEIAHKVGAYYLADVAHEAGLIAGGVNSSPFPFADVVTMTTHKTLRGPRGALIFSKKELSKKIDRAIFPGLQGGPHNHTIAGIAVALSEVLQPSFKTYVAQVVANAHALAKELKRYGFNLISGGTDKHLILIDLRSKGVSGKVAAIALEYANIVVNANTVPYDTASPLYPSGLRLGTPAVTTRGMKEREMKMIACWINEVIEEASAYKTPTDPIEMKAFIEKTLPKIKANKKIEQTAKEVASLTKEFSVP